MHTVSHRTLSSCQARVGPSSRRVRVHVASPPKDVAETGLVATPDEPKGQKNFFADAVQSIFQTERAEGLHWKSSEFSGKIEHDNHHRRSSDTVPPADPPKRTNPMLALPAPAEVVVTFRRYVTEMLEKAASSKDADAKEPAWKFNEFKGRIPHRHNGDHHDH